jgi:hypothetical protein
MDVPQYSTDDNGKTTETDVPTANLISGGLFTLALPPLLWFLVLRVRRRRWRRAKQFVDDLTG